VTGAEAQVQRLPGTVADAPAQSGAEPPAASGVSGWAEGRLQEVLTPTFWLDPGERGDPFQTTIRFSGRRAGITGKPGPADSFTRDVTAEGILPGSGPVAVTAEIRGIGPGDWIVTARPVARAGSKLARSYTPGEEDGQAGRRDRLWPRRVTVPAGKPATIGTALLPFARVPGITRYAYACLVGLGVVAGLAVQAALLATADLPWGSGLVYSLYAVVAGLAGAKAWYSTVHRGRKFDGWCIQGFVTGAAALAAAAPLAGLAIPVGAYYAAAAPGLLIGMGIGRPGCWWAGCCTGRPTASRWGIWSSDRIIGCRRIPVQPMEALLALVTGLAVLGVVLLLGLARSGPVAVAALAAYTLGRQFLLGLRADPPRRSSRRAPLTTAAAALILAASIAVLATGAV
jgi:phosphatidylglycerol:prolipoprotein diacylglycerol transferase